MKSRLVAASLLLLLTFAAAPCFAGVRWVKLGERGVTDRVDYDTIVVTAARGDFTALKIRVRVRAVQFREVKVHFGNGEVQELVLRDVIPAGGESRVLDLEGRDRVITKITFKYDAQSLGGHARVIVYGRR